MKVLGYFSLLIVLPLIVFSSCKKTEILAEPVQPEIIKETPVPENKPETSKPPVFERILDVGTGSGNLIIDGLTTPFKCKDLIRIKGGTYKGIVIRNIISDNGCPITIQNDGLVEITGNFNKMDLSNLKNVVISGDGTPGIAKGFSFSDNTYRAIEMSGSVDNFTLQNISFKNIGNYVINYPENKAYNGTEDSYMKNLKFLNINCDNCNVFLNAHGSVQNGNITGLIKNIEIGYLDFQNSPNVGTVVYIGNVEDYNIHHNKINNINTQNNNHNGIFQLNGNGKFYNNYISNHQGNALRAWGHTIGSTPKDILIYNNIVVNSRKYSGFEVQAFSYNIVGGKTTFTNAKIFNNTCGNLNTSKDWYGSVVDVYSLFGGTCDVYNNLGYNFQPGSGISNQQADLKPNTYSNLYFSTSAEAGLVDQSTFKLANGSPAKNSGKQTPIEIDYYGNIRGISPSIGAVE
ncbi:hypothetical protein [Pedobacter heparinus]|uniref:Right handed beta helix domain-containing protein n=1 Tax=Pedobacter heparinus (strain ATCC 13125 / DSM 2366 / CIP 104194 / JCM 7457 / NBRC 12017 / NCIMB 9290 / NRRL B-14731 / HIM 762-3) TaxID=485917 RepID=C6XW99_PEDHD|nr:hypothetical protein [Pedobacter heparinus]ACU04178.1 hypothetical protein Phep_1970 [Pedobacter heparinus DSM 2366]